MQHQWQQKRRRLSLFLVSLLLVMGCSSQHTVMGQHTTEILWDTWGIPHIYGQTTPDLFRAFGYAQMQSHGDLLLQLYSQARGRAAEYAGSAWLASDQYVQQMGIPERATTWYAGQSPEMQTNLDAFAAGMNEYAQTHPTVLSDTFKTVLPIAGVDVLAHVQRVIQFHFLLNPQNAGSNGWAIAPSRSQTGNAFLLANPHLPWQDLFLWYEAHLNGPDCHLYGSAFVGMPVLAIAFNDDLGWTATVNPHRGWTEYELTLLENGYEWDGVVRAFEVETIPLKVKQPDGTLRTQDFQIERSVHGPVVRRADGRAIALRVVGLEQAGVVEQFWQMGQARDRDQFETALRQLQLPMFNFLYGDRAGEILYVFNGLIPQHADGDWQTWSQPVPGNTATTLWDTYHPYDDLPRLANPTTGWLQNSNEPPWSSTWPPELAATDYPDYLTPPRLGDAVNLFRTQRSLKLLLNEDQWTLPKLIAAHADTHLELADRVLDDLITLAASDSRPQIQAAAQVLANWDRRTDTESRGAALFALWWWSLPTGERWQTPWQPDDALNTPRGLAQPEQALAVLDAVAQKLRDRYGRLDVAWGEMVRFQVGEHNLPARGASGSLGSFPVLEAVPNDTLDFTVVAGETYTAAIEFSSPIRARAVQPYGNATQPSSAHRGDQLGLYLSGQMREVWRDRDQVEANLEAIVQLD